MRRYLLFLLMIVPAPLVGISNLGEFLNAPLFLDTQIESPATNSNSSKSAVLKAGDTLKFQLFVPDAAGKQTLGFNIEFALPGKDITNYFSEPSGTSWDGSPLSPSQGQPVITALLLAAPTVPSGGYLGTVELIAQQDLAEGDILTIASATMADPSTDNDRLDVSNAAILFTDRVEPVDGDFDLDGDVDFIDFLNFARNFGHSGPAPTPIPQTLIVRDTLIIRDSTFVTVFDTLITIDTLTVTHLDTVQVTVYDTLRFAVSLSTPTGSPYIMDFVPEGEFTMGRIETGFDEDPAHLVRLNAFYIDRYEVTNERYRQYIEINGLTQDDARLREFVLNYENEKFIHPQQPVVGVTWEESSRYCEWAGLRLPTEAEWEKAARGTDSRIYPWGTAIPNETLLSFNLNSDRPSIVGSFPAGAGPYGTLDLSGNVWEYVSDWYQPDYYSTSPYENPQGPRTYDSRHSTPVRVMRGGGFATPDQIRSTSRNAITVNRRLTSTGFRCARSVEE
jgi:formylglycine-generating enzyme required for sulfatase activity